MTKPISDWENHEVVFPNGKKTDLYEPGDIYSFDIGPQCYWVCNGHEEVIIWDNDGDIIHQHHTR